MILDLCSFTGRGLMVDHVSPAETLGVGTNHRRSRGCKTRKEMGEDRENTDLSAMVK